MTQFSDGEDKRKKNTRSTVVGVDRQVIHHTNPKEQRPLQHAARIFRNPTNPDGPKLTWEEYYRHYEKVSKGKRGGQNNLLEKALP